MVLILPSVQVIGESEPALRPGFLRLGGEKLPEKSNTSSTAYINNAYDRERHSLELNSA